jgi:predicted amidophosphoribosyltransferase
MGFVKVALEDWLDFAFPRLCACCSDNLLRSEMEICWSCYANLPFSVHGYGMENPVAKSLWGRTPLVGGYFLLNYKAKSEASKMMKALKYDGGVMMAEKLGELMGEELLKDPNYRPFSHLVPVPMHPKKEKKRGYNPAYLIALGMSKSLKVPVNEKVLVKSKMTATQTKKQISVSAINQDPIRSTQVPQQRHKSRKPRSWAPPCLTRGRLKQSTARQAKASPLNQKESGK